MILRIAFFLLMALGLIGFGTVAWITTRPSHTEAVAAPASAPAVKRSTLVAARPLRAGSLLKPEDLTAMEIPSDQADGGSPDNPDGRRALVGAMIRRPIAKGDVLRNDDMSKPGEHGFLAAVLEPGMRAMTIPMDAANGSVGLIWPGDRVDLILTQSSSDASLPMGRRIGAETVLSNARVIAIDQQLVQGGGTGTDTQPKSVTLEVNSEQVQRISVAMRLGQLSVAVRSATVEPQGELADPRRKSPTWARDVLPSLLTEIAPVADSKMRVYQGAGDVKEFKF